MYSGITPVLAKEKSGFSKMQILLPNIDGKTDI